MGVGFLMVGPLILYNHSPMSNSRVTGAMVLNRTRTLEDKNNIYLNGF